jgi:hypothetical protein
MDLNSGKWITQNIVHKIPVTDVIIKAVKTMAYGQGFKTLKFKNRNGMIFHDADWIAGVDYDDNQEENKDNDEEYHDEQQAEDDGNDETKHELKPIDPGEVEDIILDAREDHNPTKLEQPEEDKQADKMEESTRRPTQQTRPIEQLEPTMTGQSYTQTKKVTFEREEQIRLEYCHNLITQTKPDESQIKEYDSSGAVVMARLQSMI